MGAEADHVISPLAQIGENVTIGRDVEIGPFTVVADGTVLADRCRIGSHCQIGHPPDDSDGEPLVLGPGARIRSHSTFYAGSSFGAGLVTGHGVVVRDGIRAGRAFQVGNGTHLEGDSTFGDCVRTNTGVLIGRKSRFGSFVHVAPNVAVYNDPFPPSEIHLGVRVDDLAVIGGSAILHPGVHVGFGAFVASGAVVRADVADATCVAGDPATPFCALRNFVDLRHRLRAPWPDHYRRGYPTDLMAQLDALTVRLRRQMATVQTVREAA